MAINDNKKIRVLVVDDSEFQRSLICGILSAEPETEVIGQAKDGVEAIEKTLKLKPDVITMDIRMPVMDGLTAIREIMAERPTPILVLSVTIRDEQQFAFTCLKHGALDFAPITPGSGLAAEELIAKVKMCARIKVMTHLRQKEFLPAALQAVKAKVYDIVGIAVSTGGPVALARLLFALPKDFPAPIVIVQHIAEGFIQSLGEWLNNQCQIKVVQAEEGRPLNPGVIYLAPSGSHLIIGEDKKFKLLKEDIPGCYHKPSADALFKSIASVYGTRAIGIIMTGMGRDGAAGIKAIKERGGFTIAQDEKSSLIYGMNKAAVEDGSIIEVLPLERIAGRLAELFSDAEHKRIG